MMARPSGRLAVDYIDRIHHLLEERQLSTTAVAAPLHSPFLEALAVQRMPRSATPKTPPPPAQVLRASPGKKLSEAGSGFATLGRRGTQRGHPKEVS